MAKRTIYRDRKTGRFVSKSTWRRSRAHDGTRYRRAKVRAPKKAPPRPRRPRVRPAAPPVVFEWIVGFTYDKIGRSFDILVTAQDEAEAYKVASGFLRDDPAGRNIVRAGFEGWSITVARGNKTDEAPGEAEYRSTSRVRKKK